MSDKKLFVAALASTALATGCTAPPEPAPKTHGYTEPVDILPLPGAKMIEEQEPAPQPRERVNFPRITTSSRPIAANWKERTDSTAQEKSRG